MGMSDWIGRDPWSDHDPYTDEALLDPWPGYKQLRDAGPAVWLPRYEMFALTRYDSVRRASFRAEAGTRLGEPPFSDLVDRLLRASDAFRAAWETYIEAL